MAARRARVVLVLVTCSLWACSDDSGTGSGDNDADTGTDLTGDVEGDLEGDTDVGPDAAPDVADAADDLSDAAIDLPPDGDAVDAAFDDALDLDAPDPPVRLCAAVRGNGQLITAHFASLARIIEHYGPIDGVAGGSSASITSFLLESIQMNPLIEDCGEATCSEVEQAARIALLLKSLQGYLAGLGQTEEAVAFAAILPIIEQIVAADIEGLLDSDVEAATNALLTILESEDLADLVNLEMVDLVTNSPDPAFHVGDLVDGITNFGNFSADDDRIFIRPGVLDFGSLAEKLGRVANFYAGYGPFDEAGTQAFLTDCAVPALGMNWAAATQITVGESTCGDLFGVLFTEYRTALLAAEETFPRRVDDTVGGVLSALISTSVLVDEAADAFDAARTAYLAAEPIALTVDFEDVRFGYWGSTSDLATVAANEEAYDDAKTAKFLSLGAATWLEVLSFSPAEPGLARALELPMDRVSAGGWSDLHPTLVLRNLGCDAIVYVTRRGNESGFAEGIATLFGMSEGERTALYDLDNTASSFSLSVAEADAVWCTDWDQFSGSEILEISAEAFGAPMESDEAFFTAADAPYPNISADLDLRGCTPGAAAE